MVIHRLAIDNAVGAVVAADCRRGRAVASKVTSANSPAHDGRVPGRVESAESQRTEHNAQFMNLVDSASRRAS
jgi:hypothetical protein